ncbi:hypothetical protein [Nocardioides solisilvae]|uniref:hypothetical protein n=1 Tax=Nocardioides solisilvae TaxID=1542435 RepID=UPI0013A54195|nr:hypothetical protein [Nocardioides solisilvae]
MARPVPRPARPAARALLVPTLATALLLGACSGDPGEPAGDPPEVAASSPGPDPAGSAEPAPVPTRHLVGQVVGRLPAPARKRLVRRVGLVVDGWLDAGFTDGPFPREVTGAWSGFTPGAARRARADRGLTTLGDLAGRIDGVRVTKRAVRYVVLAPDGRAVGATARLTLDLHTSGEVERKVRLRGRLLLTPVRTRGGTRWRIFGHDLTRERT